MTFTPKPTGAPIMVPAERASCGTIARMSVPNMARR
jgi:hypothetical protein